MTDQQEATVRRVAPAWPILTLTYEDEATVRVDDGQGGIIRRTIAGDAARWDVAAEAATEAAAALGLRTCRVQGLTEVGTVHEMVVDTEAAVLVAADTALGRGSTAAAPTARGGKLGSRLFGTTPRVPLLVVCAVVVLGLVTAILVRAISQPPAPPAATATPSPTATQLPVVAPAGWGTYAQWAAEAGSDRVAPILGPDGSVVTVSDGQVRALDPATGAQRWSIPATGHPTDAAITTVDGVTVIAITDGRTSVTTVHGDGSDPRAYTLPASGRSQIQISGTGVWATLPGQHVSVLAGGQWAGRLIPAGATARGVIGTAVVAVNPKTAQVWEIASPSPTFPKPVKLTAPSRGATVTSVLGTSGDRLVSTWQVPKKRSGTITLIVDQLTRTGITRLRQSEVPATATRADAWSVDDAAALAATGSTLIDLRTGAAHPGTAGGVTVSGGYGWSSTGSTNRVRIDRSGHTVPVEPDAPVPAVVTKSGKAIVRDDSTGTGTYYALNPTTGTGQ